MELTADSFRLQGRLPFRPRPSSGRAPPTIPKYSRTRLACSFGGASFMLSQSRLKGDGGCFGGDGGSTYFGGDGESPAFSFTVERLGSTTRGFRLQNFWMHS